MIQFVAPRRHSAQHYRRRASPLTRQHPGQDRQVTSLRSLCAATTFPKACLALVPSPPVLRSPPMAPTAPANHPRWRGQPGFFEIWFLVVFDPAAARAWWFRYTTFAPAPGQPGTPRATLWAAAFDAAAPTPALAAKQVFPIASYAAGEPGRLHVRVRPGRIRRRDLPRPRRVRKGTRSPGTSPSRQPRTPRSRGPWLLDHLPLPTRVEHANSEITFRGWVSVDGDRSTPSTPPPASRSTSGAPVASRSSSGSTARASRKTRRPASKPPPHASAAPPALRSPRSGSGRATAPSPAPASSHRSGTASRSSPPEPSASTLTSATREIVATAHATPDTFAGYVYRDPAGWDVHVAQSDIATCELTLRHRPHPFAPWGPARRLTARHGAALEFHAPEPLPGVRYIPWDAPT